MAEAAQPLVVSGRPSVRVSQFGSALLAGAGGLIVFGLALQPVAFGAAAALLLMMAVDVVASWLPLRRSAVSVWPLRRIGDASEQPSVIVTNVGSGDPLVRLRPLGPRDLPAERRPLVGPANTLFYDGDQSVARLSIDYELAFSTLGLAFAVRREHRRLDDPICRGPHRAPLTQSPPVMLRADDLGRLREYTVGDRPNRVNWPATARTGTLYVVDADRTEDELAVVLTLGDRLGNSEVHRDLVENTLAVAAALIADALGQGRSVRLATVEITGRLEQVAMARARELDRSFPRPSPQLAYSFVEGPVIDQTELARRLSLAEPCPEVPTLPRPYLLVTPEGVSDVR